jgi:hypothetical protein
MCCLFESIGTCGDICIHEYLVCAYVLTWYDKVDNTNVLGMIIGNLSRLPFISKANMHNNVLTKRYWYLCHFFQEKNSKMYIHLVVQ